MSDYPSGTSPSQSAPERRRHPRIPTDLPVTIDLAEGRHEARLRDISRAGICFFLDRRIQEMTILHMRVDLPCLPEGTLRIEGSGVVVRCEALSPHLDHYEIAVFLNDLSEEDRSRLDAYVAGGRT
jgi:hypothetical protein